MLHLKKFQSLSKIIRSYSQATSDMCGDASGSGGKKGLVIGAYNSDGCNDKAAELSEIGKSFDSSNGGKVTELLKGLRIRTGTVYTFANVSSMYSEIAVVGMGKKGAGYNELENIDDFKENARVAAGVGSRILQKHGIENITVDNFGDVEAAAEGANLGIWQYQENKDDNYKKNEAKVNLSEGNKEQWDRGTLKAECQNIARCLCETPANLLTPTKFSKRAIDILCPYGIQVYARDRKWMEKMKMNGILNSAKGSCEPPMFLQIDYCGHPNLYEKPIVLVGKGTTFNSGGLCLKECEGMSEFRADMSGAAVVVAVFKAVASMRLPINLHGVIPLFEHMISGMAMKPGDMVLGPNGKSIRDQYTDAFSRIALADALHYSKIFTPAHILSIATMSSGIRDTLGFGPNAVFSTSDTIWEQLAFAGSLTGDRMWKMPLFQDYRDLITENCNCDVHNLGQNVPGESCIGAGFLMEFAPRVEYAHIDSTGTGMLSNGFIPYLKEGLMSGRPTRTIIQYLCHFAYECNKKENLKSTAAMDCIEDETKP
uniref:Cytosol aminopeptidase n=1 Tax=Clastoptera arizonana TaxID=38151 RepID=A0A1B6CQ62_9HEMI